MLLNDPEMEAHTVEMIDFHRLNHSKPHNGFELIGRGTYDRSNRLLVVLISMRLSMFWSSSPELASRTFPIVRRHSLLHSIEQRPRLLHFLAAGEQDLRCELQRAPSAANAQHVSNGLAVHPVQFTRECQRRILKLHRAEVAML